jgi:hypothetical protein
VKRDVPLEVSRQHTTGQLEHISLLLFRLARCMACAGQALHADGYLPVARAA